MEFSRLKTMLNSLPESKQHMATEIKTNMRALKEEMEAVKRASAPRPKKKPKGSTSFLVNLIILVLLLALGIFAVTFFGGRLLSV